MEQLITADQKSFGDARVYTINDPGKAKILLNSTAGNDYQAVGYSHQEHYKTITSKKNDGEENWYNENEI